MGQVLATLVLWNAFLSQWRFYLVSWSCHKSSLMLTVHHSAGSFWRDTGFWHGASAFGSADHCRPSYAIRIIELRVKMVGLAVLCNISLTLIPSQCKFSLFWISPGVPGSLMFSKSCGDGSISIRNRFLMLLAVSSWHPTHRRHKLDGCGEMGFWIGIHTCVTRQPCLGSALPISEWGEA